MTLRGITGCVPVVLILSVIALFSIGWEPAPGESPPVALRSTTLSRQAIKQMPILERPSRPGHVYGNTVRRRYSRQARGR